jgi:ATP:ADP antiporter, AAA family
MNPPASPPPAENLPPTPPRKPLADGLTLRAALSSFLVMASYYVLRPVRDELSVEYREDTATWWLWVAGVAILAMPIYSMLVSRQNRAGLARRVFRVIAAGVAVFAWYSWREGNAEGFGKGLASSFYIAASLYPMFVVSILWSTLSECFDGVAGKTRVGPIFAAGTVGGVAGSGLVSLTSSMSFGEYEGLPPEYQLVIAASLLTLASFAVPSGSGTGASSRTHDSDQQRVSARVSSGFLRLVRSPYLLRVAGYLLLFTMGSGFLYFLQRDLIYEAYADRNDRRAVLANMDLAVQTLTVLGQALVTGTLLQRIGTARVLLIMPLITIAGFALLAASPIFLVFAGMYILRRASNYSFAKPARELLFTVVDSEERYLTKPTLDVAVYRGGDVVASQTYVAIQEATEVGVRGMSLVAIPFAVASLPLAYWLGKEQEKRAQAIAAQARLQD